MPQAMWKGSITFGLVTVPVSLTPARESHAGPELHQVHKTDASPIRLRRYCETEGVEVPYEDVARAYEAPDGRRVVLTDEDLEQLPLPSKRVIDVVAFINESEIDPMRYEAAYYVGTDERQPAKPYWLLRDAMAQAGQLAVTKVTLGTRESLAVLRVGSDRKTLVLQTIRWPDEIRDPSGIRTSGPDQVRRQELTMARRLMARMSAGFDLDALRDEYAQALRGVIDAKLGHVPVPSYPEHRVSAAATVDLMDALRASVEATEAAKPEPKSPARKAPKKRVS